MTALIEKIGHRVYPSESDLNPANMASEKSGIVEGGKR